MSRKTGFVWHELYAWHDTGTAAGMMPAGRFIQPDRHVESAETKRRLADLIAVSGLGDKLVRVAPQPATEADLIRAHDADYVRTIRRMSESGGGDAGELTPFGKNGYEVAALSAGGCMALAQAVWIGTVNNGYALSRPPGHHAESSLGRGFCLFANGVVAIRHLQAAFGVKRIAVVDWDVHHGNGTQKAFYGEASVLTISIHQDNCYPPDSGVIAENGIDAGIGANINIPLPPGSGHGAYMATFQQVVIPALERFRPEIILVLSGLDANAMDPLGRMQLHSESYRQLTKMMHDAASRICGGKLAMFHEGGYSVAYVPYCGLAVIEELAGIRTEVTDPFLDFFSHQGGQELQAHQAAVIDAVSALLARVPTP